MIRKHGDFTTIMLTNNELPNFPLQRWSRRQWVVTGAVGLGLLLVYAVVGPGLDYFGCYTWMVTLPEKISEVATNVWTLNPPWLVPFMAPFVSLPGRAGYITFMGVMIAMVILGTYWFGGRPVLVLLSAQMSWVLWWGQLEGWGVFALVLGTIALKRKSWFLMFLALAIGAFKPQIGFIPLLGLWWWLGRERWKALAAFVLLTAASIVIWGPWPWWYYQGIIGFVGDGHADTWTASLGLAALPLLLPAVLLPLNRYQRLIALTATGLLISPYLPYYSTILLLAFNLPVWAYLFAFIGYLPNLIGTGLAWNAIVLLPIGVLAWLYLPHLRAWLEARQDAQRAMIRFF